ncbi:DUF5994 family protein [Actinosynnema sp. ALI-1.44]|uniref:DUF5994 family protein n=1 Tax=Actinosynnema sp. ALI-1.44 TaxID=1933779 RepID=UPI0018741B7B|nr:DUF5994 family protein [Actinosynnema sp. ALI-1.44]
MTTDTLANMALRLPNDPARNEVRLRMKPDNAAPGHVDGGWWPRSTDSATEFPALVATLTSTWGPISRVGYNLDAWTATARKLTVHDRVVRMDGFRTMQPNTVTLTGHNRQRITLLVVPPDTPGGAARAILRSAADPGTTATVQDILTSNGISAEQAQADTATAPQPRTADQTPEERWEAEGGHILAQHHAH